MVVKIPRVQAQLGCLGAYKSSYWLSFNQEKGTNLEIERRNLDGWKVNAE